MTSPLLSKKRYDQPSVSTVERLLREARRQKNIDPGRVPRAGLLAPDGDLSRNLKEAGARVNSHWACYHTEMLQLSVPETTVGVIGCAVGAPFAVLAAEMEAAALYAFAEAKQQPVLCFAHVTNRMAPVENDFEKGEANGNKAMVDLIERMIQIWEK